MGAPKKNKNALGNKGGRPTKYKPQYCKRLIDFFDVAPNQKELISSIKGFGKAGNQNFQKEEYKLVANRLPTLTRFAHELGVNLSTIYEWEDKHLEFSQALTRARDLYKDFLIENGLQGLYNPAFAIFVAVNTTDMRQKVEPPESTPQVTFMLFNGKHTNPLQLRPEPEALPAPSIAESVEIQVSTYSSQGGQDSASGEQSDSASVPSIIEGEARVSE